MSRRGKLAGGFSVSRSRTASSLRVETLEARLPPGDLLGGMGVGWLLAANQPDAQVQGTPPSLLVTRLHATPRAEQELATVLLSTPATSWAAAEELLAGNWTADFSALDTPFGYSAPSRRLPLLRATETTTAALGSVTNGFVQTERTTGGNEGPPLAPAAPRELHELTVVVGLTLPQEATAAPSLSDESRVRENFARMPLSFEANLGQTDTSVQFLSRGPGYNLFLTATEAVMVLNQGPAGVSDDLASDRLDAGRAGPHTTGTSPVARQAEEPPAVVRMQVLGGNPSPAVVGREQLPGKVNYFLGNDPAKWRSNVPTFARVEYDEVYPGIDLVYYGNQHQLEYDFVVAPGVDPNVIRLGFTGAERLEVDSQGDLVVHAGETQLRQHKPIVYQEAQGGRREVASRFVVSGQQVGFAVGTYDAGLPLVIDPVLSYSTYLGASGSGVGMSGREEGIGIAVDAAGDAYISGYTGSTDFPTVNPFQSKLTGLPNAFVAKISSDGSELLYSTYLGGSHSERSARITVDSAGNAYVAGFTESPDFPTTPGAFQTEFGSGSRHAFITKLNDHGSGLVYSTFRGGSGDEGVQGLVTIGIAVDLAGNTYIRGATSSLDFPTTPGAFQTTMAGGQQDGFVTKLNTDGTALVYSTYVGGSGDELILGMALDAADNVYLTGRIDSADFPTTPEAFQMDYAGGVNDAFVAKLNATGSAMVYSTFLGGSSDDWGRGIAVDAKGSAYVTGQTASTDFPTADALQPVYGGGIWDAFVVKVTPEGTALAYSTYFGGKGQDHGVGIAVNATGDAYISGHTRSPDLPTVDPMQAFLNGIGDAFITRLNAAGSALVYSTFLGGSASDQSLDLTVDAAGDAYITGSTSSSDFPTMNPLQPEYGGDTAAAIVVKISETRSPSFVWPNPWEVTVQRFASGEAGASAAFGFSASLDGQITDVGEPNDERLAQAAARAAVWEGEQEGDATAITSFRRTLRLSGSALGWNVILSGVLNGQFLRTDATECSASARVRILRGQDMTHDADFGLHDSCLNYQRINVPRHVEEILPDGVYDVLGALTTRAWNYTTCDPTGCGGSAGFFNPPGLVVTIDAIPVQG